MGSGLEVQLRRQKRGFCEVRDSFPLLGFHEGKVKVGQLEPRLWLGRKGNGKGCF
jgi:hypothetical protein